MVGLRQKLQAAIAGKAEKMLQRLKKIINL